MNGHHQRGFLQIELVITTFLLLILVSVAVPQGYNFIQRAALEYETVHLANDLRRMFREQRLVYYQNAYFREPRPANFDDFSLIPETNGYRIENRFTHTVKRHVCWPGIHLQFSGAGKRKLTVNRYGYTSYNNTVIVYYGDGNKNNRKTWQRRYVIVDTAGRVRIDWQSP